jgi:hypothetical protein
MKAEKKEGSSHSRNMAVYAQKGSRNMTTLNITSLDTGDNFSARYERVVDTAPRPFYPNESTRYSFYRRLGGPRTGLNGHGERKSLVPHYQGSNPVTFIPWRVAIPATVFYLGFKIIQKPLLIQTERFNLTK